MLLNPHVICKHLYKEEQVVKQKDIWNNLYSNSPHVTISTDWIKKLIIIEDDYYLLNDGNTKRFFDADAIEYINQSDSAYYQRQAVSFGKAC